MQPESSKDPGGTSIQKLKEACELVTITKQRRHIFLNETKRTLKRGFTSSKVRLSGLRPEPFQLHWPHCLPGLRESLPEKGPGSIFLIAHVQLFTEVFQEGRRRRSDSSLKFKG